MFPLLYPPAIAPSHYPTISDRASKRAPHTPRLGLGYSAWSVRRQRGGGGIRWGNRRKIYLSATLSPKNSHNNGNSSLLCSRSYPIRYRSLQAQAQRHPHDYTYHLYLWWIGLSQFILKGDYLFILGETFWGGRIDSSDYSMLPFEKIPVIHTRTFRNAT